MSSRIVQPHISSDAARLLFPSMRVKGENEITPCPTSQRALYSGLYTPFAGNCDRRSAMMVGIGCQSR